MFKQNQEIYQYKLEMIDQASGDESKKQTQLIALDEKLKKRWGMLIGEGVVFLILVILGVVITKRAFKKEYDVANQQKNFLLSITHELKSPLASARLQLETMQKHQLDKKKQEEIAANAIQDIDRLNSLVENILLAAKIEDTGFILYKERVNFSEFLEKDILPRVKNIGITQSITTSIQPGIELFADTSALQSICMNLIENAAKYSPKNTVIRVSLEKKDRNCLLKIKDEGAGIPTGEEEKIFRKFYRIGNEETRSSRGTGLGLYLVKELVEKHEGMIIVRNNEEKGCTFELSLKAAPEMKES